MSNIKNYVRFFLNVAHLKVGSPKENFNNAI